MRRSDGVGLRVDREMRAAIEELGARLGTQNTSEIIRIGFMSGYKEINRLPEQLIRQAYREAIFAGTSAFKANVESEIAQALSEAPDDGR